MKRIAIQGKLGEGKFALISDKDYEWARQYHWNISSYGYVVRYEWQSGPVKSFAMHREVLARKLGRGLAGGELSEHRNRNILDNQRKNLRSATKSSNGYNRGKPTYPNPTSIYKGVYFDGRRTNVRKDVRTYMLSMPWRSRINANKKTYDLGRFATQEEAALAYNAAALKLHGEFACLNEVGGNNNHKTIIPT